MPWLLISIVGFPTLDCAFISGLSRPLRVPSQRTLPAYFLVTQPEPYELGAIPALETFAKGRNLRARADRAGAPGAGWGRLEDLHDLFNISRGIVDSPGREHDDIRLSSVFPSSQQLLLSAGPQTAVARCKDDPRTHARISGRPLA